MKCTTPVSSGQSLSTPTKPRKLVDPDPKLHSIWSSRWEHVSVPLDQIRLDGDTQPRVELDQDVIWEYADELERGGLRDGVPLRTMKVVFDGVDYWLIDGFHRYWALRKMKSPPTAVLCQVNKGTRLDARWWSYSMNTDHGLRRTTADKRKAVMSALRHPNGVGLSDSQIGKHVGVSDKTVAKYRVEMQASSEIPKITTRIVKRGGQEYEQDTSRIGKRQQNGACPKGGDHEPDEEGDCTKCYEHVADAQDAAVAPDHADAQNQDDADARPTVAELCGVSDEMVDRAAAVIDKSPELAKRVERGEIDLDHAESQLLLDDITAKVKAHMATISPDAQWAFAVCLRELGDKIVKSATKARKAEQSAEEGNAT